MKEALLGLAVAASAACLITPWLATVAVAANAAVVALAYIERQAMVKEERIASLESSLAALKGTAEALIKVERRTSALEHSVSAALRSGDGD